MALAGFGILLQGGEVIEETAVEGGVTELVLLDAVDPLDPRGWGGG